MIGDPEESPQIPGVLEVLSTEQWAVGTKAVDLERKFRHIHHCKDPFGMMKRRTRFDALSITFDEFAFFRPTPQLLEKLWQSGDKANIPLLFQELADRLQAFDQKEFLAPTFPLAMKGTDQGHPSLG